MSKELDGILLEADGIVKSGIGAIIGNLGKTVAVITLFIACLVTFTDVAILDVGNEKYASTLIVMIISSYLMYFSLEDVGEERGKESAAYKSAIERYRATRVKINGDMMPSLRDFCEKYSRTELEYRRRERLMYYGYSEEDVRSSSVKDKRVRRAKRSAMRLRPAQLSPRMLLTAERSGRAGELSNPERGKLMRSLLKLLPTTLCTCVTVSVVLSVKDGMTAEDVINGILKLAALPVVGIRGYVAGILFAERTGSSWLETKARILESFISGEQTGSNGET